ncbi:hypothetical protein JHK87_040166 [Glycine soja]|nr:hypothetical protein JHK87_040166 [Glycine soja]
MSRVFRERNVHVPESFERFCCVKICRDQSLKQEPVEPILDTSLDDEDSQPKDTVNSDAEEADCQHYKKMSFDLNYKLKEHEVLRELPPEIVKHYEEIETLREKLGNFLVVMKP